MHAKRKERQNAKHVAFKDHPLLSSEDIAKAIGRSEKATKAKKEAAAKNHRNRRMKAVSSDEDDTSNVSDSSDSSSDSEVEMLDCIIVS